MFENKILNMEVGKTIVTSRYPMLIGAPAMVLTINKNIAPLKRVDRKTEIDNFITFMLFLLNFMQIKWKNILVIILSIKFAN